MLIPRILRKVVSVLNLKHRTIYRDPEEKELYLTRYYIFRKPKKWMPSVYIHCFHTSDEDLELHNHPWLASFSLILSGSYKEEYRDKNKKVKTRILRPCNFNFIRNSKFHRVDLLSNEVWTFFVSGSKTNDWGFWDRNTDVFTDHETFEELKKQKKKQPNSSA